MRSRWYRNIRRQDKILVMVFKRILHPVGQGAFFTEQFYDESGKVLYNVVYDCGSFTSQPNLVEYEIRNTFERNAHIDLLFISHFDEDHVNGLMTLQCQTKIDKDTKVIIPFKYPYLLMVMDEYYPSLSRFVMQLFNIQAQVIGIEESSGEDVRRDPIAILAPMGNESNEAGENAMPIWLYYPFMLTDNDSLQSVFIEKVKNVVDMNDPNDILAKRKELRAIYKTIGKSKGGVTKINVNSLFVLSFPNKGVKYKTSLWHQLNLFGGNNPLCLYTGDSNLKGNGYDDVKILATGLLNKLSTVNEVGLVQVPHHGSRKCYPEGMADRNDAFTVSGFVNYNPHHRQKVFDGGIIGEFTRNGKTLFMVTEDYHSRIEMMVELYV